jgi:hypothetical protein
LCQTAMVALMLSNDHAAQEPTPRLEDASSNSRETAFERLKIALRPFLHHGLTNAGPDYEGDAVRAVLVAIREPSDAMRAAGSNVDDRPWNGSRHDRIWSAMITAAIAGDV